MSEKKPTTKEKGNIEIHSENIFPIIKKWLYSDRDIFVRELISNSCDAITKLKKLNSMGEANIDAESYRIDVIIDEKKSTLSFKDNGLGMTSDEVKKYINQVAFSSAEDFLEKFKSTTDGEQIIGHFGLGFYSAFMVSDRVTIETLSYIDGSEAVKWTCKGDTAYTMDISKKKDRGTVVTLHMGDEGKEFLDKFKVKEILDKYCSFLPYSIYLKKVGEKLEKDKADKVIKPKPINDTTPLWLKSPTDCTDEEYKDFYRKVFKDFTEPLFWIHLNVDYPFKLQGILYFPKMNQPFSSIEGSIKLYNNQVYVADNIKEVIPEFLLMLKGVIDCPDLPLNVSRSFLQSDKEVQRIPSYITRKVADRLNSMFNTKRDEYENYWEDIHVFVKYGSLKDEKFYDKVKDSIIYKQASDGYITLNEYLTDCKERHENIVYYVNDIHGQAPYIKMYEEAKLKSLVLDTPIDPHFISFMEMKSEGTRFTRVDSELPDDLKGEGDMEETAVEDIANAFKRATGKEKMEVKAQALKSEDTPAVAQVNEFMRRNDEMRSTGGAMPWMPEMNISDSIE
ncbi:MAG: molecular chaperone HtpG, partial [Clostridiales bacterium]|nr:molecular chaperone HtpG [Clostridiales bacterium]